MAKKLFGLEITLRKLHRGPLCWGCVAEVIRAGCPNLIGERYLPMHGDKWNVETCRLGGACACVDKAKRIADGNI